MTHQSYDVVVLGLGPAGMAVSLMAATMGLKVCAIEKRRIGGECMNVGCIPSKALLRIAKKKHTHSQVEEKWGKEGKNDPISINPFEQIQNSLNFIHDQKISKLFDKVDAIVNEGAASFIDSHTVQVGEKLIKGKRIFICTGTKPLIPDIPGLEDIPYLTNETIFNLERVPASMIILGGGAISCEMAQAFNRLGCHCTIINKKEHLLPKADREASLLLEDTLSKEGIKIYNQAQIAQIQKAQDIVIATLNNGLSIRAEKVLIAIGRKHVADSLRLDKAGVLSHKYKIPVNKYLQTNQSHIYAIGDANFESMFSHSAMHQGMLSLMNCILPWPFKLNFRNFVVPWTVFTDPQVSYVGETEEELKRKNISYEISRVNYADYGAAIAEDVKEGFIKVLSSSTGKIYGASVIGEGSGDIINYWALAIQKNIKLYDILLLQHSFPSMSFLNKQLTDQWMMKKMNKLNWMKSVIRYLFQKLT